MNDVLIIRASPSGYVIEEFDTQQNQFTAINIFVDGLEVDTVAPPQTKPVQLRLAFPWTSLAYRREPRIASSTYLGRITADSDLKAVYQWANEEDVWVLCVIDTFKCGWLAMEYRNKTYLEAIP